jgi:hypothetical protein
VRPRWLGLAPHSLLGNRPNNPIGHSLLSNRARAHTVPITHDSLGREIVYR